jgi:hypothetical protein
MAGGDDEKDGNGNVKLFILVFFASFFVIALLIDFAVDCHRQTHRDHYDILSLLLRSRYNIDIISVSGTDADA